MSEYTPEETILRDICVTSMRMGGIEFDRFIAKVKSDALREAANALPKPVGLNCKAECHTANWASLRARADRIESGDGQ
ncbi:MAG: hypothetical protein ACTIIT_14055 [Brevibacterium linens]